MNKVQLLGNLGADPDFRTTTTGLSVLNLRVATSEMIGKKDDEKKVEKTTWHRVVVWGKSADNLNKRNMVKGERVLIEGRIQYSTYTDKDGVEMPSTEIVALSVYNFGHTATGKKGRS
jgi:single-strand DNA-binding protein